MGWVFFHSVGHCEKKNLLCSAKVLGIIIVPHNRMKDKCKDAFYLW